MPAAQGRRPNNTPALRPSNARAAPKRRRTSGAAPELYGAVAASVMALLLYRYSNCAGTHAALHHAVLYDAVLHCPVQCCAGYSSSTARVGVCISVLYPTVMEHLLTGSVLELILHCYYTGTDAVQYCAVPVL